MIGADDSTIIFPNCGLSLGDVKVAAKKAKNIRDGARLLGVSERHFYLKTKELNLGELFKNEKRGRERKVTKEQIIELAQEGYIRRDVAFLLEIKPSYLKDLIKLWNLESSFSVKHGKAAWVARRGYIGG